MPEDDAAGKNIVEEALRSVLGQMPQVEEAGPESATVRQQPWADVSATSGTDKRPMEALVEEYRRKVEENPDAVISPNPNPPPSQTFFDRFTGKAASTLSRKRRRRRRGGGLRGDAAAPRNPATATAPRPGNGVKPAVGPDGAPKRRRRRRRRRPTGQGDTGSPPPPA